LKDSSVTISAVTWLFKRVEFDGDYLCNLLGEHVYEDMLNKFHAKIQLYEDNEQECFLAVEVYHYMKWLSKSDKDSITTEYANRIIKAIEDEYENKNQEQKQFPVTTLDWLQLNAINDPDYLNCS